LFEPLGQIEQNGILYHFLNIATKHHVVDEDVGYTTFNLFFQVVVVPVEVEKHFVFNDLGHTPRIFHIEAYADVCHIVTCEVIVNQNIDLFIDLVFQLALHIFHNLLSILNDEFPDLLPPGIEVGVKIVGLVILPFKIFVLDPVFAEIGLYFLSRGRWDLQ